MHFVMKTFCTVGTVKSDGTDVTSFLKHLNLIFQIFQVRSLPLSLEIVEFSQASKLSLLKNKCINIYMIPFFSECPPTSPAAYHPIHILQAIVSNTLNLFSYSILSMIIM